MDIGLMAAKLEVISDNATETRFDIQFLPYKEYGTWVTPENRKFAFELVATKGSFKLPGADIKYPPEEVTVYIYDLSGDKKNLVKKAKLEKKHISDYNI